MTVANETVETVSKRVEANRRNSQKSTGPMTQEGKTKVRLNAIKHGLTASLPVLPGEDPELLKSRTAAWTIELQPRNELEIYIVNRLVIASCQLDRCDRALSAKLTELIKFGPFDRDEAEADAVADLTRLLFWDPRGPYNLYPHFRGFRHKPRVSGSEDLADPVMPEKIVNRLASTYTGCRWLLNVWSDLRHLLEQDLNWQAPDRFRAIRLLGRQPMDLVCDERVLMIYLACDAMEPQAPTSIDDMLTEATDDEIKRIKERVRARGGDRKKPGSREAAKAVLLALIEQAVAPLAERMAVHQAHRDVLTAMQQDLLLFDDSPVGELMRRYRLAAGREFNRLLATYYKVRREADALVDHVSDPDPIGPELESRLQAAVGIEIPAEAGTPTIQPLDLALQAAVGIEIPAEAGTPTIQPLEAPLPAEDAIEPGDETKPNPEVDRGDETKPDPEIARGDETKPRPASANPPARAAGVASMMEYLAAALARIDPSRPIPPLVREAMEAETGRSLT